ncbi:hypothetical protein FRC04_004508 [Tulasnella sp. 424]|nr:hypothetical protein FRC04_004508 [Tulasnella sp. 424]
MPSFSKLTAIAALTLSFVSVAPWNSSSKLATHKRRAGADDVEFHTYHPPATYEVFEGGVHSLVSRAMQDGSVPVSVDDASIDYLAKKLGVSKESLEVKSGYKGDTPTHVYVSQNQRYGKRGILQRRQDYGAKVASSDPKLSETEAISTVETHLGAKHNGFPIKTEYVFQDTDHTALAYIVQVRNDKSWLEAFVDADSGKVVNVIDFVAHASYRAVPWTSQDPTCVGFKVFTDPADKTASPNRWHQDSAGSYNFTRGNNVVAFKGKKNETTAQSADGLVFDYAWDETTEPDTQQNLDAARTSAFYISNLDHDLMYEYGFTEEAFNFQDDNYGKGGEGGDAVEMYIQAPGSDNANFATPPDGQPGHCNLYLWDLATPKRDGDLPNDVITHEFTHGLTNRMTGGGTGRCLSTTEAGGMGEGWSVTTAFWTEQNSTKIKDYALGAWVYNNPKGIRSVLYSADMKVDPCAYGTVKTKHEVHAIGEIWATLPLEVYAALVQK